MTNRIAEMLHWVGAHSVTIDVGHVTFSGEAWRIKAKSILLLFNRGTLDVEADGNRVRVRYRFATTHQMVITLLMVSAIGVVAAFAYHGPLERKLLAALFVVALGWACLFGCFFISAKFYVPFWLRRGLRDLPELKGR